MKKNRIAVFRIGQGMPLPKEVQLVKEIVAGEPESAMGAPINIGVFSIFITSFTADEVAEKFRKLAEDTNDVLPVIVFDVDNSGVKMSFQSVYQNIDKIFQEMKIENVLVTKETASKTCNLTMDELLEKIKANGIESLSTEEMRRLDTLSQQS